MEVLKYSWAAVALSLLAVALFHSWKFLNWVWLRPRKVGKRLRQQGWDGNSYKLLFGDIKDMEKLRKEVQSKPMSFSHEIVPRIVPTFHRAVQSYGKNFFLWLGPTPALLMMESDSIREILSKSYVFQKPGSPLSRVLPKGIASYETDKWAKHRRLINPAFYIDKLKHMVPSFYTSCADMMSKWEAIIPSEGSCELDVWPYLQTLTSDAISRTAFGSSYEEGRKIFELQREQIQVVMEASFLVSVPGSRFLPNKFNRRMKKIVNEVESSVMGIIDRRMKRVGGSDGDLLGLLLESNTKEIEKHGSKFGMSLKEVVEECRLFYLAGQETTSTLLVWTMILLSKHVDWQVRAREEVLQLQSKPGYEELNHLKILSMIFYEVLRLYPPAIALVRTTKQECTIGNFSLPAGVHLILPTILVHHDRDLWGDDAQEFKPERFSDGVSKATQGKLSYFPFGWGPRICLGQNFAMLEAKIAMVTILQNYSFELSPSYSHAPSVIITLQPQHGAHLIMRKING